ncbi:hypothetical protein E1B28_011718 [Marasmius oreades]|uniref:Uncharacterized protein n=1 Tax=Marasmius oreades TaxID=181124 RepID=A0A9P7URH8_9AGAR|nr:uncharacterized protein E1B28_011718 [Marasmius oreades]KAG7090106.1 hypothetical protein E1B28_011718 [Marasmius oreades]
MSTQRKEPRKYICTCQRFCRARLPEGKTVSKSTYYSHAKQRELEKGLTVEELQNVGGRTRRKRQRTSHTHLQSTLGEIEGADTSQHSAEATPSNEIFGEGVDVGISGVGLDNDTRNSSDYDDRSNDDLDDDPDSIENDYSKAAPARPDVAPANFFVESSVDGIQEKNLRRLYAADWQSLSENKGKSADEFEAHWDDFEQKNKDGLEVSFSLFILRLLIFIIAVSTAVEGKELGEGYIGNSNGEDHSEPRKRQGRTVGPG